MSKNQRFSFCISKDALNVILKEAKDFFNDLYKTLAEFLLRRRPAWWLEFKERVHLRKGHGGHEGRQGHLEWSHRVKFLRGRVGIWERESGWTILQVRPCIWLGPSVGVVLEGLGTGIGRRLVLLVLHPIQMIGGFSPPVLSLLRISIGLLHDYCCFVCEGTSNNGCAERLWWCLLGMLFSVVVLIL